MFAAPESSFIIINLRFFELFAHILIGFREIAIRQTYSWAKGDSLIFVDTKIETAYQAPTHILLNHNSLTQKKQGNLKISKTGK
jgi:hypothetical protein